MITYRGFLSKLSTVVSLIYLTLPPSSFPPSISFLSVSLSPPSSLPPSLPTSLPLSLLPSFLSHSYLLFKIGNLLQSQYLWAKVCNFTIFSFCNMFGDIWEHISEPDSVFLKDPSITFLWLELRQDIRKKFN